MLLGVSQQGMCLLEGLTFVSAVLEDSAREGAEGYWREPRSEWE